MEADVADLVVESAVRVRVSAIEQNEFDEDDD